MIHDAIAAVNIQSLVLADIKNKMGGNIQLKIQCELTLEVRLEWVWTQWSAMPEWRQGDVPRHLRESPGPGLAE